MTKRALIVGNTDGIGLALTHRLLAEGWTVLGVSRRDSEIAHAGYRHITIDVRAADYPARLTAALTDGLDLCVYAAGIGDLLDLDRLAEQTESLAVNLIGAARTVEAVVPVFVAAGSGHLIGLSSLADAAPSPVAPGYAASKAGLSFYLKGLAIALRPHGVAVTTVRFGFVDTKMAKSPMRPAMMGVPAAVDIICSAIRSRRAVLSRPRRIAAAMALVRLEGALRLRRR